jgi:hydroxymethylpyrimidine/phosphomethylpyrimidine kinase
MNPAVGSDRRVSIVVVGGVDPAGGAGLLRDLATATRLGARPFAVGTAWTAQGAGIHRVEPRAPEAVGAALAQALGTPTLRPAAVKIGMAVGPATAAALMAALADFAGPVVVDPVLATSRGGPLWSGAPGELLPLLRRATLVTPNALEAAALCGRSVTTVSEAEAAGRRLIELEGLQAVLIKGGHLTHPEASVTDVLVTAQATIRTVHPVLPGPSPRGTGCALATAIAVELGRGRALGQAVASAIGWLAAAFAAAEPVAGGLGEWHLP